MASAVARAYNGGLGAEPPAGSRGRATGQGVSERSRSEAEAFLAFGRTMEAANLPTFRNFETHKDIRYLCYLCKKSWAATKLAPGPGLKPPLETRKMVIVWRLCIVG